jgi:hypothetical protein
MGSEGGGGGGNFSAALSDHDAVGASTGAAAATGNKTHSGLSAEPTGGGGGGGGACGGDGGVKFPCPIAGVAAAGARSADPGASTARPDAPDRNCWTALRFSTTVPTAMSHHARRRPELSHNGENPAI